MLYQSSLAIFATLLTSSYFANAINIDCANIVVDGVKFDVHTLTGPHSVHSLSRTPTKIKNTTFTVDICQKLGRSKDKEHGEECPNGSQICALQRFYPKEPKPSDPEPIPEDLWPISGEFVHEGRPLDPYLTRLKGSDSHADSEKEGFRIEMHGGFHEGLKQKAFIEFICDHAKTGLEGLPTEESKSSAKSIRAEGDGGGNSEGGGTGGEQPPDTEPALPDTNKGKSLQFVSYGEEPGKDEKVLGVLRLQWFTKYACEKAEDGGAGSPPAAGSDEVQKKKSGWGFFTWFIIILFLSVAAYLIFGSWLNYSRFGARGWDLLPHGDMIRDVPYLLKDWARRVLSTVQGGGHGRGYSAI